MIQEPEETDARHSKQRVPELTLYRSTIPAVPLTTAFFAGKRHRESERPSNSTKFVLVPQGRFEPIFLKGIPMYAYGGYCIQMQKQFRNPKVFARLSRHIYRAQTESGEVPTAGRSSPSSEPLSLNTLRLHRGGAHAVRFNC